MSEFEKIEVSPARLEWNPSPITEQVVLVTTVDGEGRPHVATKSRITIVSYGPPTVLVFGCQANLHTAANLQANEHFVVNVPGGDMTATSWVIGCDPEAYGPQLFAENGLTPISALKVGAPRIAECRAHVECKLLETRQFGDDLAVFGEVVSVSMNEDLVQGEEKRRYSKLAPFFFLDFSWTAPLGSARLVEEPVPGPQHDLTMLVTEDVPRAANFYGSAFDWPVRMRSNTYVEFSLPEGRSLALCSAEGVSRSVGQVPVSTSEGDLRAVQIYLRTDDPARIIARLVAAGARELSEFSSRDWGEEAAYFADPDGNILVIARGLPPVQE